MKITPNRLKTRSWVKTRNWWNIADVFVTSGLDSRCSSSSGGFALQLRGYNALVLFVMRLKRFDKTLFDGYSVKEHKSKKQGTLKYTYAIKCQGNLGRRNGSQLQNKIWIGLMQLMMKGVSFSLCRLYTRQRPEYLLYL